MVKVLWKSDHVEEVTWKPEASLRKQYPLLFSDVGEGILRTKFLKRGVKCDNLFSSHFHTKLLGLLGNCYVCPIGSFCLLFFHLVFPVSFRGF